MEQRCSRTGTRNFPKHSRRRPGHAGANTPACAQSKAAGSWSSEQELSSLKPDWSPRTNKQMSHWRSARKRAFPSFPLGRSRRGGVAPGFRPSPRPSLGVRAEGSSVRGPGSACRSTVQAARSRDALRLLRVLIMETKRLEIPGSVLDDLCRYQRLTSASTCPHPTSGPDLGPSPSQLGPARFPLRIPESHFAPQPLHSTSSRSQP